MLVVTEIEDGVFRVELTDMHYDCMDKTSKKIEIISEAVLAMWIGCGMVELAGFAESEPECSAPPKSLDQGYEVDDF